MFRSNTFRLWWRWLQLDKGTVTQSRNLLIFMAAFDGTTRILFLLSAHHRDRWNSWLQDSDCPAYPSLKSWPSPHVCSDERWCSSCTCHQCHSMRRFFPPPLNLNQLTFLRDPQIHFCIFSVGFFQPSVPTFWQKSHQGSQCTIAMYVQPTGLTFLLLLQSPEGLPLTWDLQVDVCRCVFQIYHFR